MDQGVGSVGFGAEGGVRVECEYTANHGNMHVHFKFVTSLRRYAESYLLVCKALIILNII